jgi:hypothetical protein
MSHHRLTPITSTAWSWTEEDLLACSVAWHIFCCSAMSAKSNFCAITETAQTVGWTMDSEEDSGLPPCQAAAKDPEGSFTLAAAERGGLDSISATTFSSPAMCQISAVCSAM